MPLSDDDFSVLRNLSGLRVQTIRNVHLTDRGMEHLGGLRNLSKLTLGEVTVRNAGLGHLRGRATWPRSVSRESHSTS